VVDSVDIGTLAGPADQERSPPRVFRGPAATIEKNEVLARKLECLAFVQKQREAVQGRNTVQEEIGGRCDSLLLSFGQRPDLDIAAGTAYRDRRRFVALVPQRRHEDCHLPLPQAE